MDFVRVSDVAARAGVSSGTVSNYFHKPDLVAAATAERIRAAVDALGYVPNLAARSLRRGGSGIIAALSFEVANPYSAALAQAFDDAARSRGYAVFSASSGGDEDRQRAYLELFAQHRVDGILLSPLGGSAELVDELRSRNVPVVALDAPGLHAEVRSVSVDDVAGARAAAEHLLELGHRRILFAGAQRGMAIIERRIAGVAGAIDATPGAWLSTIDAPVRSIAEGRRIGERIAAAEPADRPTAVIAVNDLIAVGILHGVFTSLRVPDDLSIVGFDDIEFAAEALVPLTSVARPIEPFATAALDALTQAIDGEAPVGDPDLLLPPTLVVRESSGPAPGSTSA